MLRASLITAIALLATLAQAREGDGHSQSPLHAWFETLHSGKGPCCADADGTVVIDSDWQSKDGHYRVFIEDKWWDVPNEAVITEPNRDGRTIVWPIRSWQGGNVDIVIRGFMPGSMI